MVILIQAIMYHRNTQSKCSGFTRIKLYNWLNFKLGDPYLNQQQIRLPWQEPGWFDQVHTWIKLQLGMRDKALIGSIEQIHLRHWSIVLRVPSTPETLYFKAVLPVLKHEVPLTLAMASWFPQDILPIFAADVENGWLLIPDGGQPLRSWLHSPDYFSLWAKTLDRYGSLQRELESRQANLLENGAPDRRLEQLPSLLAQVLSDPAILRIGQPEGLSPEKYASLNNSIPSFMLVCQQLAAFGISETIHHDDFHDANIFISKNKISLTDWGEAGLAHPFYGLMIALRGIVYRLEISNDTPEIQKLIEGYLHHWDTIASFRDLKEAFRLSHVIAMANRAITWHQVVSSLPEVLQVQYAESVSGWLEEFLDHFEQL
jgi:hypothetical protein